MDARDTKKAIFLEMRSQILELTNQDYFVVGLFYFFLFKIKYLYSLVFNTKFYMRFLGIMNTWITVKNLWL